MNRFDRYARSSGFDVTIVEHNLELICNVMDLDFAAPQETALSATAR